jgi:hypothetical protein
MARILNMATISSEEFGRLRRALPAATQEGVMQTYRISQHSWYKLRDGKPVKQSVIDRMRARYAELVE